MKIAGTEELKTELVEKPTSGGMGERMSGCFLLKVLLGFWLFWIYILIFFLLKYLLKLKELPWWGGNWGISSWLPRERWVLHYWTKSPEMDSFSFPTCCMTVGSSGLTAFSFVIVFFCVCFCRCCCIFCLLYRNASVNNVRCGPLSRLIAGQPDTRK